MSAVISIFLISAFLMVPESSRGQGCVALNPMNCTGGGHSNNSGLLQEGQWQVTAVYRYFRSYKHFRGDVEQVERVEQGTQVVNTAHTIDLSLTHALSDRFTLSTNVPLISYDRSSLYEHYGNSTTSNPGRVRFSTDAMGIGDLRVSGLNWLFDPQEDSTGNLALGIGIKIPTGNANVQDDFHKRTSDGRDSIVHQAVDQSIQLGDGGWGFNVEVQAYRKVFSRTWLYVNAFYMFNPKNFNTTLTRGTLTGADPLIAYHSVADQYSARVGMNYAALPQEGISVSLGVRIEGIPPHDVIGSSEGFRRPGYIISVEPGVSYMRGNGSLVLNAPVALYRNRTKSVFDLADPTGQRHGDAAFADYLINATIVYRFGKE
ncbi:MAG: hypothetical protein HY277_09290 [Ignavibacteriales bacterium]|nr:hypothetical protein [Ignavibacteriales bacterium]